MFNDSNYVSLEGNKSQVLVWTTLDEKTTVLNQATNVTVSKVTTYQNLAINVISSVLEPPGSLSMVIGMQNLSMLGGALSTTTTGDNSTSLLSVVEAAKGFTIFAPNDAAFKAASSTISSLPNATVVSTVLANHIINGSTVYSPSISSSSNLTSAAGESLSFMTNSSGSYVMSGSSVAKIVKTDVLVKNGVLHIINGVLANTGSDSGAASSAYSSATAVAAKPTTETGPVGGPTTSASPTPSKGAGARLTFDNKGGLVGVLICAVGGVLTGGLLVI